MTNNRPVIYYSYWYDYGLLAITKLRNKDDIVITRAHRYDLYNEQYEWGYQAYKEQLDSQINRVVCISNQGNEYYSQYFATDKNRVVTNYLGVKKPLMRCLDFNVIPI